MNLCINPRCQKPNNSGTLLFCQGCGSELLLDGRYRVVRELAQGGFGKTYEIIDFNSCPWVLKVLMGNHPKHVELFQQEAQVLSILNHTGIPQIDLDGYFLYFPREQEEPLHCLVMEKIEGLNLKEYIQQRGNRPIKPKRVLRWLAELVLILEQVHNQNFFHRDIKPSNIMLQANGCLVLIDFGTVREINKSYIEKQVAGNITGIISTGYTPMEQMRGKAVLQSDFYALGATMTFLLTAQNPSDFYDSSDCKLHWHQAAKGISSQFADLIDRMMAFSPLERPTNTREIFNEIIAIDSSLQVLDECFNSASSHHKSKFTSTVARTFITDTSFSEPVLSSLSNSQIITPEFVARCRQELAKFIGPIATTVCNLAVEQNLNMSKVELCMVLAKTIHNPKKAKDFQQGLIEE